VHKYLKKAKIRVTPSIVKEFLIQSLSNEQRGRMIEDTVVREACDGTPEKTYINSEAFIKKVLKTAVRSECFRSCFREFGIADVDTRGKPTLYGDFVTRFLEFLKNRRNS
jgi:hypothetical protein